MLWQGSPRRPYVRSQHPTYGAVSSTPRIRGPGIKRWKWARYHSPLPVVTNSWNLMFFWPRSLSSRGTVFHQETWQWLYCTARWDCHPDTGFSCLRINRQRKDLQCCLYRMIDPNYQGDTGVLFHNGGKEVYVQNAGDLSRGLLLLPCPVIRISGKL